MLASEALHGNELHQVVFELAAHCIERATQDIELKDCFSTSTQINIYNIYHKGQAKATKFRIWKQFQFLE